jgi:hypothetical protein
VSYGLSNLPRSDCLGKLDTQLALSLRLPSCLSKTSERLDEAVQASVDLAPSIWGGLA